MNAKQVSVRSFFVVLALGCTMGCETPDGPRYPVSGLTVLWDSVFLSSAASDRKYCGGIIDRKFDLSQTGYVATGTFVPRLLNLYSLSMWKLEKNAEGKWIEPFEYPSKSPNRRKLLESKARIHVTAIQDGHIILDEIVPVWETASIKKRFEGSFNDYPIASIPPRYTGVPIIVRIEVMESDSAFKEIDGIWGVSVNAKIKHL